MYGSLVLHKSNNGTEIHDAGKPLTDEFTCKIWMMHISHQLIHPATFMYKWYIAENLPSICYAQCSRLG